MSEDLDLLGVAGRIAGSLALDLALLAAVAPFRLAAGLADLLLVWRVSQRLGQAVAKYSASPMPERVR